VAATADGHQVTPETVAAELLHQAPDLVRVVLTEVAARWGNMGVQRTLEAAQRLAASLPAPPAHAVSSTSTSVQRDGLNAVITVVARGADGHVVARWRARGHWEGALPARYHGQHAAAAWSWSDPAARDTRLNTQADGTGGLPLEAWAAQHGAVTVDVVAESIDAATGKESEPEAHADDAGRAAQVAASGHDMVGEPDPEQDRIVAVFERKLGIGPDPDVEDDIGGHGALGGDPHGRTGAEMAVGGSGPGGLKARAGGDHEGSETHGAVKGSRHGSALGVEGGSEGGLYDGEGKPGDDGVRGAGAIAGGVIAIPATVKGAVELLLIADQGDITGMGAGLFTQLGRKVAGMSATALRELVAHEARAACTREVEAAVQKLARSPKWLALSAEQQTRAMRIAYFESMRRYFRGFREAAQGAERTGMKALRRPVGVRRAMAQESLDAGRVGAEAAEVEPVAGRLPRNHEFAGKEFPRELLPPKYRENGLRFKRTGYPDFEPYAATLPNGRKTVKIELTGSRQADRAAANRVAGFERTPEGYTWQHVEDEGTMMLVPTDLHRAVGHTGGAAKYVERIGVMDYD